MLPNLHSNLQYMLNYSDTSYPEGQYYLTQFLSAEYFVQNTQAETIFKSTAESEQSFRVCH